jgi:hypothetical protein
LTSTAVRVRPDGHKARIERGEVVALRRDPTVVGTDKVQFDQPVDRRAVKQAQDFRDDDGCGRGTDEGRADGLAGEQRDAAPVERSVLEQPAVRRGVDRVDRGVNGFPEFGGGHIARQRVNQDAPEIRMTAAKARLAAALTQVVGLRRARGAPPRSSRRRAMGTLREAARDRDWQGGLGLARSRPPLVKRAVQALRTIPTC